MTEKEPFLPHTVLPMSCFDGSDYALVGNHNVTPPYGGQLLSAAQRMRTAGGV